VIIPAVDTTRIPLLGQPGVSYHFEDPQAWAEQLNAFTPSNICEPTSRQGPFSNSMAMLPIGGMRILSTLGSAIQLESSGSGLAHLVMPYKGLTRWRVDRHWLDSWTRQSLLYVPPGPLQIENTVTAGIVTFVDPDTLLETALLMAGPDETAARIKTRLAFPRLITVEERCNWRLADVLYSSYQNLDSLLAAGGTLVHQSRIDDQILRLWVLLLLPELRDITGGDGIAPLNGEISAWVHALADWIQAHAAQPLALSDLERQAGYSRRTLQVAFRTHIGCTPMQWVKRCRMSMARERLKHPLPHDTVSSIAQGLGFLSGASFSRDFKQLFGEQPSAVLWQARNWPISNL
jgi:AraC-like DNA-binding protein